MVNYSTNLNKMNNLLSPQIIEPKKVKGHVINIPCNVQNYLHTFKISKKSRGLSPFSTIFQLSHGGQFYYGGNRSTQRKPQNCRKSLTNFSHNVVSSTPRMSGQTHNFSGYRH